MSVDILKVYIAMYVLYYYHNIMYDLIILTCILYAHSTGKLCVKHNAINESHLRRLFA